MTLHDIKVKDLMEQEVSLDVYKGKVVIVVNTATKCGLTPQLEGLQKLYDKYKEKGLEILSFPCNQFAKQSPGSNEEIKEFCDFKYRTKFPQFDKIDVNGKEESPLYTFLKKEKGGIFGSNIKWNFCKFVCDKNGKVIKRFSPFTKPEKMEKLIIELLNK